MAVLAEAAFNQVAATDDDDARNEFAAVLIFRSGGGYENLSVKEFVLGLHMWALRVNGQIFEFEFVELLRALAAVWLLGGRGLVLEDRDRVLDVGVLFPAGLPQVLKSIKSFSAVTPSDGRNFLTALDVSGTAVVTDLLVTV